LYGRIIKISFLILELPVKEICCSHGQEAVPLRKTVTDRGIEDPKVASAGVTTNPSSALKISGLMDIISL
jgi:hypothetical protein